MELPFTFTFKLCHLIRPLHWRHNGHDGVSNHQPYDCLLNRLFRRRSKKSPKLRVTGLCEENLPVTDEFSAQRASNAQNVSIWWRHYVLCLSEATTAHGNNQCTHVNEQFEGFGSIMSQLFVASLPSEICFIKHTYIDTYTYTYLNGILLPILYTTFTL